jgi:hypothetical protein
MCPVLIDPTASPVDWMSVIDGSRLLCTLTLPSTDFESIKE